MGFGFTVSGCGFRVSGLEFRAAAVATCPASGLGGIFAVADQKFCAFVSLNSLNLSESFRG